MSDDEVLKFELDGVQHEFAYARLTVLEGLELEKLTGKKPQAFLDGLETMDPESTRFMVWLTLKREGNPPDGRYSEFDFDLYGVFRSLTELNEVEEVVAEASPDPTQAETPSA
jgi:hypothetical protein